MKKLKVEHRLGRLAEKLGFADNDFCRYCISVEGEEVIVTLVRLPSQLDDSIRLSEKTESAKLEKFSSPTLGYSRHVKINNNKQVN